MKYSILIPVYNVETYLPQCLDSVLAQTLRDFEVILVDDGSTDGSGAVCDRYQQSEPNRIRVIHKENQGLISARRVGIQAARGKYCVFVDSDDFVEPDLLQRIEAYLGGDPEIDVLLYSFRYDRDGNAAERYPAAFYDGRTWHEDKSELYRALAFTNKITTIWTKAIRRELLLADPTDYTVYYGKNMAEDLLQSLYPITAARKVRYTDAVLYHYRINTQSISHSYTPERIAKNDTKHVYAKLRAYMTAWGLDSQDALARLNARWFNDTMYQFCKCYECADTRAERRRVLRYDWASALPAEVPEDDPYVNQAYARAFRRLRERRYFPLTLWFMKRAVYARYKKLRKGN